MRDVLIYTCAGGFPTGNGRLSRPESPKVSVHGSGPSFLADDLVGNPKYHRLDNDISNDVETMAAERGGGGGAREIFLIFPGAVALEREMM